MGRWEPIPTGQSSPGSWIRGHRSAMCLWPSWYLPTYLGRYLFHRHSLGFLFWRRNKSNFNCLQDSSRLAEVTFGRHLFGTTKSRIESGKLISQYFWLLCLCFWPLHIRVSIANQICIILWTSKISLLSHLALTKEQTQSGSSFCL